MEQTSTKPKQVDEEAKTQASEQAEGATPNPDKLPVDTRKEEEMTQPEVKAK